MVTGVVILVSVPDRYHTDPSGTFVRYDAKAIGSGSEAAQSELQDKWHKVCHILAFSSSDNGRSLS